MLSVTIFALLGVLLHIIDPFGILNLIFQLQYDLIKITKKSALKAWSEIDYTSELINYY